jgi:hypothetical protein
MNYEGFQKQFLLAYWYYYSNKLGDKAGNMIRRFFIKHPNSVGENYFQHLANATSFGLRMLIASLACLVHGIFPFLFERTGSATISELHDDMITHRDRPTKFVATETS